MIDSGATSPTFEQQEAFANETPNFVSKLTELMNMFAQMEGDTKFGIKSIPQSQISLPKRFSLIIIPSI